ncbi:MAG TPA: hypothetical protein PKY59_24720 [Pyrinomonadaceae bacterium]|nr:hypothetical protein [Pyrinomonadaceae bacterium]
MFEVTNLSNNPLQLSDGKIITPGATKKLKQINDRDQEFQRRGWLQVIEEKPAEKSPNEGGKK